MLQERDATDFSGSQCGCGSKRGCLEFKSTTLWDDAHYKFRGCLKIQIDYFRLSEFSDSLLRTKR